MNLHTIFLQLWTNKFPSFVDSLPQLDCLKADQFLTVNEQRAALEIAQSEISASVDHLQTSLNQQLFISDYLRTCITKLSAVSRVFNELENGNENGSGEEPPSLKSNERRTPQSDSNRTNTHALNLSVPSPTQVSSIPLVPTLLKSSPALLSATSRNLLLHSALNSQPAKSEPLQIKSESPPAAQRLPPTATEEAVRYKVDDISTTTSEANSSHAHDYRSDHQQRHRLSSHRPSPPAPPPPPSLPLPPEEFPANTFNAARVAAAAVSAALGFHFPPSDMFNLNSPARSVPPSTAPPISLPSRKNDIDNPAVQNSKNDAEDYASRPYRCTTCGRGFAVKAGLMQHLRTHTDERPYPCPECGRAFKQKIQLTTHIRVHSGERPYGCRICGKLFRQQSHVVQHLRTHTGEKPHKCTRCNKAFRQKYSLISHQRRMCQSRMNSSSALVAGMTMWIGPGGRAAEKAAAKAAAAVEQHGLRSAHSPNLFPLPSINTTASPSSLSITAPTPKSNDRNPSPGLSSRVEDRSSCSPASSHGGGSVSGGSAGGDSNGGETSAKSFRHPSTYLKHSPICVLNSTASTTGQSFHENDYSIVTTTPSSSSYPSPYHSGATDLRLNSSGGFQSRLDDTSSAAMEAAGV